MKINNMINKILGKKIVSDKRSRNMANPASVFAHQQGLQTRIVNSDAGQYGEALVNGNWVEEWKYFRENKQSDWHMPNTYNGKPKIRDGIYALGSKNPLPRQQSRQIKSKSPIQNISVAKRIDIRR